jgi:PAS domain S-box-containing protein
MKIVRELPSSEKKEDHYRSVFETTTDGLIISDFITGRVLQANPAACAMHAYARAEFIGLLPAAFIHSNSQKVFSKSLQTFRSGILFTTRVLHVCRDGSTYYAEWRGTAFTFQAQPCLLSVVWYVSQRILAEQRLHQRIEARTRAQSICWRARTSLNFAKDNHDEKKDTLPIKR